MKACLDTVSPITDGTWNKISSTEKLDIYQTIVNIESSYNGFSKPIKVCYATINNTEETNTVKYGQYSNLTATIYLNEEAINYLPILIKVELQTVKEGYNKE